MALSPLRTPSYQRSSRRGGSQTTMVFWGFTLLGLVLVTWAAWRFGFGLPARCSRAISLAQQGRTEEALERLNALAGDHPGHPKVLDALGLALNRSGKSTEAQDSYEKSRDAGTGASSAGLHCEEGASALARGAWAAAAVEFEHAASLDKRSAKALAGQAGVAMVQGRLNQAQDLYKQALAQNPGLKEASDGARKVREATDRGSLYYMFDRHGEPLARRSIGAEGLGARSYPRSQLTAHVVGYLSEKAGNAGLERDLAALFPGAEVELTLDLRMQEAASRALGWRKGALVALDPATGEILAAISQPSFQPGTVDKDWHKLRDNNNKPLEDRALDGLFEPGSIAKIMTAAAALEANVDMGKIFPMVPQTSIDLDGKIFRDWENHGKLRSLKEAMDVSSNIALYKVAHAMGPDALYRMIGLFGFNKPMDLSVQLKDGQKLEIQAASPRAPQTADTQFALAERACGLGTDYRISPLQAARLAATIANKGKLMRPRIIRQVRGLAGGILYDLKPELDETVMSAETAEKVKALMEDAVEGERGIGKRARVEGIRIAGKTGTARTHKKGALDAWFICFAPADKPKIAVAVFCDQEGTGMHVAAPIAGAFLSEALR